jgi:transcription initiation factor TFIIIB Brf1 subunit/transcription initiation factor TFIIB
MRCPECGMEFTGYHLDVAKTLHIGIQCGCGAKIYFKENKLVATQPKCQQITTIVDGHPIHDTLTDESPNEVLDDIERSLKESC